MRTKDIKTILFPTDFSNGSVDALKFAVNLAQRTKSKLVLLNVVDTPFNFNMENEPVDLDLITSDLIDFSNSNLNKLKKLITEKNSIKIETVTYTGETTSSIVKAVHNFKADLILMGTKITKDLFFKSSSFNIVKNTGIPMLTINEGCSPTSIKNILFPFNENFSTLQKAEGALQLAKLFNAKITLLGVSQENSPEKIRAVMNNMLIIKDVFDKNKIISEVNFSSDLDYSYAILNYCHQNQIDLVTVANNLKTSLIESNKIWPAQTVISNAKIPVLTIPVIR